MDIENTGKLRSVLDGWLPETVATSAWLSALNVSPQLTQRYVRSRWIVPLGSAAFKRPSEKVQWFGAVHSLQTQLKLLVHVGALSAISAHGASHYLRMGHETVYLFTPPSTRLPKWFVAYDWGSPVHHAATNLLPEDIGLTVHRYGNIDVRISTLERAILECLYLSPEKADLVECYEIAQGLLNLRPKLVQELLETCKSVKVKRLFLYMAEKAALPVFKTLNLATIYLGKGDRSLARTGLYDSKYGLILPEDLVKHE